MVPASWKKWKAAVNVCDKPTLNICWRENRRVHSVCERDGRDVRAGETGREEVRGRRSEVGDQRSESNGQSIAKFEIRKFTALSILQ